MNQYRSEIIAICLVVFAIFSRWLPHPPNVAPVTAVALFSAMYVGKKWTIGLPLFITFLSDVVLGFYGPVMFSVYGSYLLISLLGLWIGQPTARWRIAGVTLLASVIFYLVTNAGVWWFGSMYTKDFLGLISSYTAGLPFFRNSLVGDALYMLVLVVLYQKSSQFWGAHAPKIESQSVTYVR